MQPAHPERPVTSPDKCRVEVIVELCITVHVPSEHVPTRLCDPVRAAIRRTGYMSDTVWSGESPEGGSEVCVTNAPVEWMTTIVQALRAAGWSDAYLSCDPSVCTTPYYSGPR